MHKTVIDLHILTFKNEKCQNSCFCSGPRIRHTFDPHSAQYVPLRSKTVSHTEHRRISMANADLEGSRTRSATITAIAVPVRYSARMCSAKGSTPSLCSHDTISFIFASTSVNATTVAMANFRCVRFMKALHVLHVLPTLSIAQD